MGRIVGPKDVVGLRYGNRVIVSLLPDDPKSGYRMCIAKCDCGRERRTKVVTVIRGGRGCPHCWKNNLRHGHAGQMVDGKNKPTPTYHTWKSMLSRCESPKHTYYSFYGGRGIRVCRRWHNFKNFLTDMGERPEGKTLDRKDPNAGYSPKNCRWATWRQQGENKTNNRKILYRGAMVNAMEASRLSGILPSTIISRLNRGWSGERLFSPINKAYSHKRKNRK